MHHANLVRRFAEAGLTLSLASRPIVGGLGGRGAGSIVQIDIQRKTNGSRRHEWFRIFPGAEDNRIEVVGLDKRFGQVVVMIHEPEREFNEPLSSASPTGARSSPEREVCGSRTSGPPTRAKDKHEVQGP